MLFPNVLTYKTIGLHNDAKVILNALAVASCPGRIRLRRRQNGDQILRRLWYRLVCFIRPGCRPAANFFLEQIAPGWSTLAEKNIFIPNQEWCRDSTQAQFDIVDVFLCKTRYAESIFHRIGTKAVYVGFTSEDRYREDIQTDNRSCLHVAGSSKQKGTSVLLDLWAKHPEWPILTIVAYDNALAKNVEAPNIKVIQKRISTDELIQLQNRCGVHLCPSEAEGYGHYICEGLSCGAIVVTTDAPPMNELVGPDRGFVVAYNRSKPQSLGTNFYVDPDKLEDAIEKIIGLEEPQRGRLSRSARAWFHSNREEFHERFSHFVRDELVLPPENK